MQVLYFASLRESRGCREETVSIEPGETLGALYGRLFPPSPEGVLPVAYARNRAYADADAVVEAGDEISFLPPIGGG